MESENTVTYFLFNDRKSTLRCSFILIYSLTFFELYFLFYLHFAPSLPQHGTILFYLLSLSFSSHPYFIATPPPIRLFFALLHLNILHYINKKTSPFQFYSSPSRARIQSFHPSFSPLFPFPIISISLSFIPISIPIKILFSTPPQFLCYKGMTNLSCNSYDIAPQKQCNCHLKALLLERNSYSFAPQRLCPQPTRA